MEFARLAAGLALLASVVAAGLYFGGSGLARLVPFETEAALVGDLMLIDALQGKKTGAEIVPYLQELTDRLAKEMDVPANMNLRVHYIDTQVPNAFASLGGHIA